MVLGWERCPAEAPQLPVLLWELRTCCRLCLLEYARGGISMGRNIHCEVWPGFWICVCMLVGSSGAGRFPAFPCACPASGAPRGCTTSVTSADGAPGAQLGAELWPLDSPVSAGSAQGLQGHRNSARSSVRSSRSHPGRAFPLQQPYCYPSFFCREA